MQVFAEWCDFEHLCQLVAQKNLPLTLSHTPLLAPKALKKVLTQEALLLENGRLFWLRGGSELQKVTPNWSAMQQRVLKAGRKSELLLQALKADHGMVLLDGTAGFGHDTLLLASTGATVVAMERHPVMALLLFFEYERMCRLPHWQKLLSCIRVVYGDFLSYKPSASFHRVYLDPMFPKASYHAKVGKHMQLLHGAVAPATDETLKALLCHAKSLLGASGKVVVKRPISAVPLGEGVYFANEVLRFERYE